MLPPVHVRDVMGALTLGRRKVLWRDESSPQEQLFVFPIQDDQSHDQVLILAQEFPYFMLG